MQQMSNAIRAGLLALLLTAGCWPASVISIANGNWTAAATWGLAEAGATAIQITRTANTNTTVAWVASSAWTCTNLDVLDGVLMHARRLNTTGTVSVGVSDDNGATWTRTLAVNASDLPASNAWIFFRFASTLTCDGGADYKVGVTGSSAGNATFYRDATAGNWSRVPRTTATAAPVAADLIYVSGELTGAGASTPLAVTMNETANTDYGAVNIGYLGTLSLATAAATNYYLKTSGVLDVWADGVLNFGTVATPLPATSSFHLDIDCTVNVEFGLVINDGGTWIAQGAAVTAVSALLAVDAAVNAVVLTSDIATGWKDNDQIAVASTTRTATQSEIGAMNGDAVGTTLNVKSFGGAGGGVAFAHSGTSPTQAEIINLTRNIKIHGASATLQAYILVGNTATVGLKYVEIYWMGSNTSNKRGINITTTTGTAVISHSSIHDFVVTSSSVFMSGVGSSGLTYTYNVSWNISGNHFINSGTTVSFTVTDCIMIRNSGSNDAVVLASLTGTFERNTVVSAGGSGIQLYQEAVPLSFQNNTAHSNNAAGFAMARAGTSSAVAVLTNCISWRNTSYGIQFNLGASSVMNVLFNGGAIFGNSGSNIYANVEYQAYRVIYNGMTIAGDSTFGTAYGIRFAGMGNWVGVRLENSSLGAAAGVLVAHSTADIFVDTPLATVQLSIVNTTLGSATQISGSTNLQRWVGAAIRAQRLGGVAGTHRTWLPDGQISSDNVIFKTAAPSERLTPANAAVKLESGRRRQTLLNTATATFNVWVRKSVVGDGADYNGAEPRLVLKANPALGVNSDSVLDTMVVGLGTWELLTGTTPAATDDGAFEVVVDCDGTVGWVNVAEARYWIDGLPVPEPEAVAGGGVRRYSIGR